MSRILRINSTTVDIDSSTKVSLSYASPIFSDLQKLTANTSLTIKLPLSAHNRSLIDNVNTIGVDSGFPYDYFRVDYEEDGLIIIDNGRGYLLSVNESIEVSVIFGGVSNFARIKDAKLNNMPITVEQGQIHWENAQFAQLGTEADIMFLEMDFGLGLQDTVRYAHPSVRATKVIEWINQAYGLAINPSIARGLIIPCVTKKRRSDYGSPIIYKSTASDTYGLNAKGIYNVLTTNNFLPGSFTFTILNDSSTYPSVCYTDDARLGITGKVRYGSLWVEITMFDIYRGGEDTGETYERDSNSNEILSVDIKRRSSLALGFVLPNEYIGRQFDELDFRVYLVGEHLTYGEDFDTLYNLPAIKVVDFLKGLMQLNGVFPLLNQEEGIDFVSVDTLYDNIAIAKDWSDKISKVNAIGFSFGEFGQNNTINWAEDETVSAEASKFGLLVVENKTLDSNKEVIKLPFAASDNLAGSNYQAYATIPIYVKEVDKDGTESIEYKEVKPRIVREWIGSRGMVSGYFDDTLHMNGETGIIATKYAKYQEVIKKPKTVKVEMILTPKDKSELDLLIPVYVEQLHGYFAVISITTKEYTSDVELLRL